MNINKTPGTANSSNCVVIQPPAANFRDLTTLSSNLPHLIRCHPNRFRANRLQMEGDPLTA